MSDTAETAENKGACCPSKAEKKAAASSCCPPKEEKKSAVSSCCPSEDGHDHGAAKWDLMLWICGSAVLLSCIIGVFMPNIVSGNLHHFAHSITEITSKMWWGVLLGIGFIGFLAQVPQKVVMGLLGTGTGVRGILRATFAGVFLDLCSHGILMVGMKLYERGASLGQVMAFLLASPWNSLSLTLILWGLIGLPWTLTFLVLSMIIGVFSGIIFDRLVTRGTLPDNPHREDHKNLEGPETLRHWWAEQKISGSFLKKTFFDGLSGARIVIRWMVFGVVLAALIRVFVPLDMFETWLGPTFMGFVVTMIAATIIEVCSEGSTPIAADILVRAKAPGNSFAFLMTGVSTDYTEVMVLKDTTRSWKIALFLPLVTVPQIVVLAFILNMI